MRIAQSDILEFTRDPGHVSPEFPAGYWPRPDIIATPAIWRKTIKGIRADLKAVEDRPFRDVVSRPFRDVVSF